MKQTMKRTLAIVLAALTALCLLPTAFGEDAAPAKTVEIVVDETKSDSSVYTIMESGGISLDFDKTMVLTVVVTPEGADKIEWTSEDTSVVEVSQDGTVKGVGAGASVISATVTDGDRTYTASVTVYSSMPHMPYLGLMIACLVNLDFVMMWKYTKAIIEFYIKSIKMYLSGK